MFLGLSSSAGRLLSGVLCDRAWCKPLILTSIVVSSASLPALMMASVSSYSLYLTLSCLFGLLTGSLSPGRFGFLFFQLSFALSGLWIAATSPLLVSILGVSLLPSAFGLMTAVQGVSALLGPPLAGALVDWRHSLSSSLHLTAALLLISAAVFILALLDYARRMKRRQYIQMR